MAVGAAVKVGHVVWTRNLRKQSAFWLHKFVCSCYFEFRAFFLASCCRIWRPLFIYERRKITFRNWTAAFVFVGPHRDGPEDSRETQAPHYEQKQRVKAWCHLSLQQTASIGFDELICSCLSSFSEVPNVVYIFKRDHPLPEQTYCGQITQSNVQLVGRHCPHFQGFHSNTGFKLHALLPWCIVGHVEFFSLQQLKSILSIFKWSKCRTLQATLVKNVSHYAETASSQVWLEGLGVRGEGVGGDCETLNTQWTHNLLFYPNSRFHYPIKSRLITNLQLLPFLIH